MLAFKSFMEVNNRRLCFEIKFGLEVCPQKKLALLGVE